MARSFNPSNQPMTCLYCGAKLKHKVYKASNWQQTVSLCCQAHVESRPKRQDSIAGWGSALYCSSCNRELVGDAEDTEVVTHARPETRSKHAGYADFFCTYDCGYRFGCLAAEKGVRYVRRPVVAADKEVETEQDS